MDFKQPIGAQAVGIGFRVPIRLIQEDLQTYLRSTYPDRNYTVKDIRVSNGRLLVNTSPLDQFYLSSPKDFNGSTMLERIYGQELKVTTFEREGDEDFAILWFKTRGEEDETTCGSDTLPPGDESSTR